MKSDKALIKRLTFEARQFECDQAGDHFNRAVNGRWHSAAKCWKLMATFAATQLQLNLVTQSKSNYAKEKTRGNQTNRQTTRSNKGHQSQGRS